MKTTDTVSNNNFLLGQMQEINKKFEQKFIKEIHPLIKQYHDLTGNKFLYEVNKEVIIQYDGFYYWVHEGPLGFGGSGGIWFHEKRVDSLGRPYGDERNGDFYLIARLCSKYQKEIESKIEFDLKEMMK